VNSTAKRGWEYAVAVSPDARMLGDAAICTESIGGKTGARCGRKAFQNVISKNMAILQ